MSEFPPDSTLVSRVKPSPNHDERKTRIDMIVLHYTGMTSADDTAARLSAPESKVSSHYLVYEDGVILQLVPEARRAWHAGVSSWLGITDINSCSIGIEIANPGHDYGYPDFPDVQIGAVIALCRDLGERHTIPPARVLAHSDVAPARKSDPGEKFPWDRLAARGIGRWIEPTEIIPGPELDPGDRGETIAKLQAALRDFGYDLAVTGHYDDATKIVVAAFQRHFRSARVDGVADRSTIETLHRLLHARGAPAAS